MDFSKYKTDEARLIKVTTRAAYGELELKFELDSPASRDAVDILIDRFIWDQYETTDHLQTEPYFIVDYGDAFTCKVSIVMRNIPEPNRWTQPKLFKVKKPLSYVTETMYGVEPKQKTCKRSEVDEFLEEIAKGEMIVVDDDYEPDKSHAMDALEYSMDLQRKQSLLLSKQVANDVDRRIMEGYEAAGLEPPMKPLKNKLFEGELGELSAGVWNKGEPDPIKFKITSDDQELFRKAMKRAKGGMRPIKGKMFAPGMKTITTLDSPGDKVIDGPIQVKWFDPVPAVGFGSLGVNTTGRRHKFPEREPHKETVVKPKRKWGRILLGWMASAAATTAIGWGMKYLLGI